jgi:hypothetical protein
MTTLQKMVEIPADHRLTVEVPWEFPAGPVILTLTPAARAKPLDPCLEGAVNPSIRDTVKITGDIIGPFFDEWENTLDEGEGIW